MSTLATVKRHVSSIFTKLGLRDRAQAVVFADESGLTTRGHRHIGHWRACGAAGLPGRSVA